MDSQKELVWKMRGILVDWLMEVHCNFGLLPETLFLAVNIIDRFLSARVVSLIKLQLVGVTALFIASKYEEVMAPSIKNFTFMADGSLKDADILKAERYVLQVLDFQLCYPNPMHFLRRASKADNYDIYTRTVAKYFMEIPLVDHRFMACPPSLISASALFLAKKILSRGDWVSFFFIYCAIHDIATPFLTDMTSLPFIFSGCQSCTLLWIQGDPTSKMG
jgi:G2/mitotic-specific cyclin 1/2